jgi:hypothetical protein
MGTRNLLAMRRGSTIWLRPRRSPRGPTSASIAVSPELFAGFDGRPRPVAVDVEIENRETRSVGARLRFQAENGFEASAALALEAGEILPIGDALSSFLNAPHAAGTLTLEPGENESALPLLFGRAYPRRETAEAPVGATSESRSVRRWIADLSQGGGTTSEIVAVNRTSLPLAFEARLRASDGTPMSSREGLAVAPGESRVWSLEELFGFVEGEGLTLEVAPAGLAALPEIHAVVADREGGRLPTLAAERPASRYFLPAAGRTSGAGDTSFATDLSLANSGDRNLSVRASFFQAEKDNSAAPSALLTLGPRETRRLDEVLGALFGLTEVSGFLEIEAERDDLVIAARLTARSESSPGIAAAPVSPVREDQLSTDSLLVSGEAGGIPGIGLLNPEGAPVPAVVEWLDASGAALFESTVVLPPQGLAEITVPEEASGSAISVLVRTERLHFAYVGRAARIGGRTDGPAPRQRVIVR